MFSVALLFVHIYFESQSFLPPALNIY